VKRGRRILVIAAVVVIIGVLVALLWPGREPEYEGKKLSEWLTPVKSDGVLLPPDPSVCDAVHHMGSNAVPWLLRWVKYNNYKKYDRLIRWAYGRPPFLRDRIVRRTQARQDRAEACGYLFASLGPAERSAAIPELTRLSCEGHGYAFMALLLMRPESLPAIIKIVETKQSDQAPRINAIEALPAFQSPTNRFIIASVLTNCLNDPNPEVARAAARAISSLTDVDPTIRKDAAERQK
jgi:hypothetical protein